MQFHPALFAALVALGASAEGPTTPAPPVTRYILELVWPNGGREWLPATSRQTCEAGARAALEGHLSSNRQRLEPARSAICHPGNGFAPREDCIVGFNCGRSQ